MGQSATNLDLIMDKKLHYNPHINNNKLSQMVFYELKSFYQIKNYLPKEMKLRLRITVIISKLIMVYGPCLRQKNSQEIQALKH